MNNQLTIAHRKDLSFKTKVYTILHIGLIGLLIGGDLGYTLYKEYKSKSSQPITTTSYINYFNHTNYYNQTNFYTNTYYKIFEDKTNSYIFIKE